MTVTPVSDRRLSRGAVVTLSLALLVLTLAAAALLWLFTRGPQRETLASGVQIEVIEEGQGDRVTPADLVAMRYRLTRTDGTLIQDSDETGQPFVASTGIVFPGFAEGLQRMRAGGRYRLWLPPGQHVQEPLPAGVPFTAQDTLVFEIEVLQIAPGMAHMQQQMGENSASGAPAEPGQPPDAAQRPQQAPSDGARRPGSRQ